MLIFGDIAYATLRHDIDVLPIADAAFIRRDTMPA